jgi:hypothetical protein
MRKRLFALSTLVVIVSLLTSRAVVLPTSQVRLAAPTAQFTAADFVDSIPQTTNITGAKDLIAELTYIGQQIAADGQHYPPGVNLHNSTNNHFLYTYGRSLFAIAQTLPFLPGDVSDPLTVRGAVAAYLRSEVQTHMLDGSYFDVEESGSVGYRTSAQNYRGWAPAVLRSDTGAVDEQPWWNPQPRWRWGSSGVAQGRGGLAWGDPWRARADHSRWEGLLALWAYAHYTGDWSLIDANWSTVQSIRASAPDDPFKPIYPDAPATNAWVMGLTAYARLARGVGDGTAEAAALADLNQALNVRYAEGVGGDKGGNFDYTSLEGIFWIEGWDEWTAEFGRWLLNKFGASQIDGRIQDLVTDGRIFLWYESDMSHAHNGENQQQTSWISFPIYQAHAAALTTVGVDGEWTHDQAARTFLRDHLPQPVVSRATPYHRDAYYMQNLVTLIRAHGTTTWTAASSDRTAIEGQSPDPQLDAAGTAYETSSADSPVMPGRVKAPILLVDDTVYVGTTNRHFYALDAATGNLNWRYAANANIESSAAYANGKVIFMTEVGYDPDLPAGQQVAIVGIALNAADGSVAWKASVPGERAGASYPVVAGDYVLFIGEPPDESPYGIWITNKWEYFGSRSYVNRYGGEANVLRLASEMLNAYPHHRASKIVHVDTGQERLFDIQGMAQPQPVPLGSVYNNWIIPTVYQDKFLFTQFHGLWVVDPTAGSIAHRLDRGDWMVRQEEYQQFVGGMDYLIFSATGGELYWMDLTAADGDPMILLMPEWGHFPDSWLDPIPAELSIEGGWPAYAPGQGNGAVEMSGYAIPYNGRLYVAAVPGWFYAFEGTYVPASTQNIDDWPQFMHDPQNTGFSQDGLQEGPYPIPRATLWRTCNCSGRKTWAQERTVVLNQPW